jgi:hypothetical protein
VAAAKVAATKSVRALARYRLCMCLVPDKLARTFASSPGCPHRAADFGIIRTPCRRGMFRPVQARIFTPFGGTEGSIPLKRYCPAAGPFLQKTLLSKYATLGGLPRTSCRATLPGQCRDHGLEVIAPVRATYSKVKRQCVGSSYEYPIPQQICKVCIFRTFAKFSAVLACDLGKCSLARQRV